MLDENDFKFGIIDSDCDQPLIYRIFDWVSESEENRKYIFYGIIIVAIIFAYIWFKPYPEKAYIKDNKACICQKVTDQLVINILNC